MEQIKERELSTIIEKMNNRNIRVRINGVIAAEFVMCSIKCKYNTKNNILVLYDRITRQKITVQMVMAYIIKVSEDREVIYIGIDNDEEITITNL